MKLVVDENVSHRIVERLRLDGHDIILVRDVATSRQDVDIAALAHSVGAVVLTEDTDFGDIVMRHRRASSGVILLRLSGMERVAQPDHIARTLAAHAASIPGSFTAIAPAGIRIRPLP